MLVSILVLLLLKWRASVSMWATPWWQTSLYRVSPFIIITITINFANSVVPDPEIDLQLVSNPPGATSFFIGSSLNITCSIDISPNVNTNFTVEVEWTRNGEPPPGPPRVTTSPVTETTPNHYQTQLIFTGLNSTEDTGDYECAILVSSMDSLMFVEDADEVNDIILLTVLGKFISYFLDPMIISSSHQFPRPRSPSPSPPLTLLHCMKAVSSTSPAQLHWTVPLTLMSVWLVYGLAPMRISWPAPLVSLLLMMDCSPHHMRVYSWLIQQMILTLVTISVSSLCPLIVTEYNSHQATLHISWTLPVRHNSACLLSINFGDIISSSTSSGGRFSFWLH